MSQKSIATLIAQDELSGMTETAIVHEAAKEAPVFDLPESEKVVSVFPPSETPFDPSKCINVFALA